MTRKHFLGDDLICTFCQTQVSVEQTAGYNDRLRVSCPCCGVFDISGSAESIAANSNLDEPHWTAIAYRVRQMTDRDSVPLINSNLLRSLRDQSKLPLLDELIDDVVLWLGRTTPHPGFEMDLAYSKHKSRLGAVDYSAFNNIIVSLRDTGLFQGIISQVLGPVAVPFMSCQLTPDGWMRYRELSNATPASRHAFMAMKYNDPQLDEVVRQHFAPAVKRTGFELKRLDQGQAAGLIDDQLRVQIRTSRFLMCDLTHANRGAYWEAGFAEGLGRPVIYTCREDVFQDPTNADHPHFDTNHFVTIVWRPDSLDAAAKRLVDTIRATLPQEAAMQDLPVPISV